MVAGKAFSFQVTETLSRRVVLPDFRPDRSARNRRMDFGRQTRRAISASDAQVHLDADSARRVSKSWGAHAPRVLISASRRNVCEIITLLLEKFAMTRASSPAREGACAPQTARNARSVIANVRIFRFE